MKADYIIKTNDPNLSFYKELSRDFIRKERDKVDFNKKLEEAKKIIPIFSTEGILLIAEVKHPVFSFDAKDKVKEAEDQLYRCLNQYQKHYGILSNGKVWSLYDKSKTLWRKKIY